jgi:Kdo2-lipid IVA lauroyltransferase/acyltransferase
MLFIRSINRPIMSQEKKYPFLKKLTYRLEYALVKMMGGFANLLSVEQASAVAAFFGRLAFYLLLKKRQTALDNLAFALPEKTNRERYLIARESFANAAISMTELFMIQKIVDTSAERFDVSETRSFDKALAEKKGVILACSHLGAWECHELLCHLKHTPLMVIVKNLKNPYVNNEINRLRTLTSVIPYDKDRAIRGVFAAVKKKGIAAILLDQWAGPDGIWIPFFGRDTSTTTIAARFAQKTGAIIIPSFCIRVRPGRYKLVQLSEIIVTDDSRETEMGVTRKLNEVLEQKIREYPEQWTWGHRRWKDQPQRSREE